MPPQRGHDPQVENSCYSSWAEAERTSGLQGAGARSLPCLFEEDNLGLLSSMEITAGLTKSGAWELLSEHFTEALSFTWIRGEWRD